MTIMLNLPTLIKLTKIIVFETDFFPRFRQSHLHNYNALEFM